MLVITSVSCQPEAVNTAAKLQEAVADIHYSSQVNGKKLILVAILKPPSELFPLWFLDFGLQELGTNNIGTVGCTEGGNDQPLHRCLDHNKCLKVEVVAQAVVNANKLLKEHTTYTAYSELRRIDKDQHPLH